MDAISRDFGSLGVFYGILLRWGGRASELAERLTRALGIRSGVSGTAGVTSPIDLLIQLTVGVDIELLEGEGPRKDPCRLLQYRSVRFSDPEGWQSFSGFGPMPVDQFVDNGYEVAEEITRSSPLTTWLESDGSEIVRDLQALFIHDLPCISPSFQRPTEHVTVRSHRILQMPPDGGSQTLAEELAPFLLQSLKLLLDALKLIVNLVLTNRHEGSGQSRGYHFA